MRGRLIFPFLAVIHRLDRGGMTQPVRDGWRDHASGFDPDFKEPVRLDYADDGQGEPLRREHPPVEIPCQVSPRRHERLEMQAGGASPRSQFELVMHFRDLAHLGLVDEKTGNAKISPGDRLDALLDLEKTPQLLIKNPPGLFVVEARPSGFGLGRRPQRNLLIVTFGERRAAMRRIT